MFSCSRYFGTFSMVLLCGLGTYLTVSHRIDNDYPDSSAKCESIRRGCKDEKTAKECGILAYCQRQWSIRDTNVEDAVSVIDSSKKMSSPDAKAEDVSAKAVDVHVYFEALCPDSEKFIIDHLYPTFKKLNATKILNLVLIPYGKATQIKRGDKWIFTCQHGPEECLGNTIETCAIHIMGHATKYVPFIYCMEKNGANVTTAKKCLKEQGMKYDAIEKCVEGPEGNYLEHLMGLKTEALNPPATFIPWITVNGQHSQDMENLALTNFHKLVCDTFKGQKPKSCIEVTKHKVL